MTSPDLREEWRVAVSHDGDVLYTLDADDRDEADRKGIVAARLVNGGGRRVHRQRRLVTEWEDG